VTALKVCFSGAAIKWRNAVKIGNPTSWSFVPANEKSPKAQQSSPAEQSTPIDHPPSSTHP
jgi:hypothetical protein